MIDLLELLEKKPTIKHTPAYFTIEDCIDDKQHYYIFGDNTKRFGNAGQAIIRSCPNAYGIATKFKPSMDDEAFFDDNMICIETDVPYCMGIIAEDYLRIPIDKPWIVNPNIGKGLAKLDEVAPRTLKFLQRLLEIK